MGIHFLFPSPSKSFPILLLVVATIPLFCRTAEAQSLPFKQLGFMVIPATGPDEDIRTKIQHDPTYQLAIAEVQKELLAEGYKVLDFEAKLRKAEQDQVFKGLDRAQTIKDKFLEYSGADIHLELNYTYEKNPGEGNRAVLQIGGFFTATSLSLIEEVCKSNYVDYHDPGNLVKRAFRRCLDNGLLEALAQRVERLVIEGQPVQLHFQADLSDLNMNTEMDGTYAPLRMVLLAFIDEQVLSYRSRGNNEHSLILDEVRIPFFDDRGKYYPPWKFSQRLWQYCRKLRSLDQPEKQIKVDEDRRGGTFYFSFTYP
jgi:hypothetical protein